MKILLYAFHTLKYNYYRKTHSSLTMITLNTQDSQIYIPLQHKNLILPLLS